MSIFSRFTVNEKIHYSKIYTNKRFANKLKDLRFSLHQTHRTNTLSLYGQVAGASCCNTAFTAAIMHTKLLVMKNGR